MLPPSEPGIAPGVSQSRRRRRAGADTPSGDGATGRGRMTQEDVPPPPPPPPPPPRNGAPPQQSKQQHEVALNASLDSSIASSVRKDADMIMSSVHGGHSGAAGGPIAASPAHHVSSSSSGAGAAPAGAGGTDRNAHHGEISTGNASIASSTKQPMHISTAASPDQLPRVARKQNRHRHGLGAAPSSAVSEPPLGLADSSVFARASISDGPDSGGSSNDKVSHGGRGADRGMSSDPFYIAPTRELLLSQYMVGDKQYQDFLLYGKGYKDDNLPGYDCGGVRLTPKSAAKMCAGWSAVGMIFMLWAGLMIQCQPLYLKGINYNSGFVKRSGGGGGGGGGGSNVNNYNVNINYAGEQMQNQQEVNEQYNSYSGQGGSGRRPIRPQASNAFKAAAAYFVTMVFSLICFHNHEQMGDLTTAVLPRWRVLLNVRQNCIVAYHQYRRRHYTDIPDTPSKGHGGRRRRRKKGSGEDGELPLFQSASSETTRRRRVGGGGPGSGSGSGFSGADDGDGSDVGSLPLYRPSGVDNDNNAAENFTRELWNKVKGGMRSPLSRRRGRDTKTKHV